MAEKRRFYDVWIIEANTVYREVPFDAVADFGPVDRGCFLLPQSGCLVGVADDGSVKRFDPRSGVVVRVQQHSLHRSQGWPDCLLC